MKNAPWAAASRDYDRQQAKYKQLAGTHGKKHHKNKQEHVHTIIRTPKKKHRNMHDRYIQHATMKNAPWAAAARDYDRQQAKYKRLAGTHGKKHHKKHDAALVQVDVAHHRHKQEHVHTI